MLVNWPITEGKTDLDIYFSKKESGDQSLRLKIYKSKSMNTVSAIADTVFFYWKFPLVSAEKTFPYFIK